MENVIEQFVQGLIKKAGIDNMPEDFKKEYTEKLAVQVQQRLGMVALQELDEKGIADFEEFMGRKKTPEPNESLEFFNSRIPDFPAKIRVALEQFSNEFVQGAVKLKGTKLNS